MALSLGEGRVEERWWEVGGATKPPVEIVEARVRQCQNRQGRGSGSESTGTKKISTMKSFLIFFLKIP